MQAIIRFKAIGLVIGRVGFIFMLLCAASFAEPSSPNPATLKAGLFPLSDIRLLDGPLRKQQELNRQYLLRLNPDRLLSWFRREAGLEPKAPPYLGWESEGHALSGHILGFYMSGAAMTVQATGDEVLRRRLDYIVDQLAEVQSAHGSGYMLACPNGKKVFADVAAGKIDIAGLPWNGFDINGSFEPVYTMNKLMLGLYQIHLATGSSRAKQVLLRLADWFGTEVVDKLDEAKLQHLLQCEHGSLPEGFVNAWELSGDTKYLTWARRLCHERMLKPLADNNRDFLTHFHANSNIPKFTGFEGLFRAAGELRLHTAAMNFWEDVATRRSWAIGGNSAGEHFFDPKEFESAMDAPAGPESCNSVNMLRLTEALHRTEPSARQMDFYERVLFNHILAAHDPEQAMCCYYTTMRPGGYRVYSDEFNSMWCCTGTGLEVPGKYGQMIFTRTPDEQAILLNLFASAELRWRERGITVRQTTSFPYEDHASLLIRCEKPDARFALRIRHPAWVVDGALKLAVNGQALENSSKSSSYAEISRVWSDGDTVDISFSMRLTAETLPGNDHYVAILCGPIVLSGELGRSGGLVKEDFWQIRNTIGTKPLPKLQTPNFCADSVADILKQIQPVPGQPLRFDSGNLMGSRKVRLTPFFENHFQRYAIYWHWLSKPEWNAEEARLQAEARELAELDARSLDHVVIGDADSEQAHNLQGQKTQSGAGAYGKPVPLNWRDTQEWFSFDLSIPPGSKPGKLRCTYWGREQGARTFDVLANGEKLETRSLGNSGKDDFMHVELALPEAVTRGKTHATIRFQAHPGNTAGGLFDLRLFKAE